VKTTLNTPKGVLNTIKASLTVPQQNFGNDEYIVDLQGHEKTYWAGTESRLLGAFYFDGDCTVGDDSCDTVSHSMGVIFCNFQSLGCHNRTPLESTPLTEQREQQSSKVGRSQNWLLSENA
jgi:hypothetical protein